jgi:hypothetical protein
MEEFSGDYNYHHRVIQSFRNYRTFRVREIRLTRYSIASPTDLAPASPKVFPLFANAGQKYVRIQWFLYSSSVDQSNPFVITSELGSVMSG